MGQASKRFKFDALNLSEKDSRMSAAVPPGTGLPPAPTLLAAPTTIVWSGDGPGSETLRGRPGIDQPNAELRGVSDVPSVPDAKAQAPQVNAASAILTIRYESKTAWFSPPARRRWSWSSLKRPSGRQDRGGLSTGCGGGGATKHFALRTRNSQPVRLTAGPDGKGWFVEQRSNKIGRITPGAALTECPLPSRTTAPEGITLGADGAVWFTELGTNRLGRLTPSGNVTDYAVGHGYRQLPGQRIAPWSLRTCGAGPYRVACQGDGTTLLPRPWDHLGPPPAGRW